jgi:hypothetical protein
MLKQMWKNVKIVDLNKECMWILCTIFATLMQLFKNEKLEKEVPNVTAL